MKRNMAGEITAAGARGSIEMLMWGGDMGLVLRFCRKSLCKSKR